MVAPPRRGASGLESRPGQAPEPENIIVLAVILNYFDNHVFFFALEFSL